MARHARIGRHTHTYFDQYGMKTFEANNGRKLEGLEVAMAQVGDSMGSDLIIGRLRGPIRQELLNEAVFRVQSRHPLLRSSIFWPQGRQRRPHFVVHEPDRQFSQVKAIIAEGDEWKQIVESLVTEKFDLESGCLLKVTRIYLSQEESYLVVAGHHAVVDGTSLMRILNQILHEYQTARDFADASGGTLSPDRLANTYPVHSMVTTPSLASRIRFGWRDTVFAKIGKSLALREIKDFTQRPWFPLNRIPREPFKRYEIKTVCCFARGTENHWLQLQAQCKSHNVTVGGAFSAAVQLAVSRYLISKKMSLPMQGGKVRLQLSMDYNMRDRVDVGKDDPASVGLYTSIAEVGVPVSINEDFWQIASRIIGNAREKLERREPQIFQKITDEIFDLFSLFRKSGIELLETSGVAEGINISNVGRYPFPTKVGNLDLEDVYGFNGASMGGPMMIFWLRFINGRLCYNAIGASPAIDREALTAIFNHVFDIMENIITADIPHSLTFSEYIKRG